MDFTMLAALQQRALTAAQNAVAQESMGSPATAAPLYHQAAQDFLACAQLYGGSAPAALYFQAGACQVRIANYNGLCGQQVWAREWLAMAHVNFQSAWQREPHNPLFHQALAQASAALGQVPTAAAQPAQGLQLPAPIPEPDKPAEKTWAQRIADWLGVGKQAVDVFQGLGQLFGGAASPGAAAAGSFNFNPDDYAPADMDWGSLTGGW